MITRLTVNFGGKKRSCVLKFSKQDKNEAVVCCDSGVFSSQRKGRNERKGKQKYHRKFMVRESDKVSWKSS